MSIFLIIMIFATGAQVFMRYVLNNSLTWSEELSRYCFVFSGFFSAGYCIKKNTEIRLDLLTSALPARIQTVIDVVSRIVCLAIFILLFRGMYGIVKDSLLTNQTAPALAVPMSYINGFCAVGLISAVLRTVQRIYNDITVLKSGSVGKEETK